jgi:hypothetical protein
MSIKDWFTDEDEEKAMDDAKWEEEQLEKRQQEERDRSLSDLHFEGKAYDEQVDKARKAFRDERERQKWGHLSNTAEFDKKEKAAEDAHLRSYIREAMQNTDNVREYESKYRDATQNLYKKSESAEQFSDDQYKNIINKNLRQNVDQNRRNAGQAMTLAEAGDVNNSIHRSVRGLYDERADQSRKTGTQDYGILAALGAQATGNAINGPMTAGQLQGLQSANLGRANTAYQRALQRAQDLEDQGIAQGFVQSDAQYKRGVGERQMWQDSVNNLNNQQINFDASQGALRNEQGAILSDQRGSYERQEANRSGNTHGMNDAQFQNAQADVHRRRNSWYEYYNTERDHAASDYNEDFNIRTQRLNRNQSVTSARMAGNEAAANAARQGIYNRLNAATGAAAAGAQQGSSVIGAVGTVVGGYYGGTAGAAAGGAAGNAVGQAGSRPTQAPQQAPQTNTPAYQAPQQQPMPGYQAPAYQQTPQPQVASYNNQTGPYRGVRGRMA